MSIGNLPKRIRRTYSRNAYQVIAYFPILEGTPKESEAEGFRKAKALLYHHCMSWVLRGLIDAGKRYILVCEHIFSSIYSVTDINSIHSGIIMRGPDGKLRNCYPVVMSFMVDYPEACLLCLIRMNYACPVCMAPKEEFSCLDKKHTPRTVSEMKMVTRRAFSKFSKGESQKANKLLQGNGLRAQTVSVTVLFINVIL